MPEGPKGQKRPADVIGNTVHVMRNTCIAVTVARAIREAQAAGATSLRAIAAALNRGAALQQRAGAGGKRRLWRTFFVASGERPSLGRTQLIAEKCDTSSNREVCAKRVLALARS
jgi:hypothetical protein